MPLNCGVEEDSWVTLGLQADPTSPSWKRSVLGVHWKDWCWSWNSNTLATWCKELTHWKRPWCWERLKAGGEGNNRGWDGWMASPTQWTWVWVNSRSWWWTRRPSMLQSMESQRVGHNWVTELNWWERIMWASTLRVNDSQHRVNWYTVSNFINIEIRMAEFIDSRCLCVLTKHSPTQFRMGLYDAEARPLIRTLHISKIPKLDVQLVHLLCILVL